MIPRTRHFWSALTCVGMMAFAGCKKPESANTVRLAAPLALDSNAGQQEPPTVMFDLNKSSAASGSANSQVYDCTYQARGKLAKFRLEFGHSAMSGAIPMASAHGRFLPMVGSENAELLGDLMKALEAKQYPARSPRVSELAFDAVLLGEKQSRNPTGGYADKPPGDWMVVKIFLPKGGDEGEVFLNLNPVLGKGEFSIKDSDYGDYVVTQLAKVL
jgi:hypothetical protein